MKDHFPLPDNKTKKNPVPIGLPSLEINPPPPQDLSLLKIGENCIDILEAILNHHTKDKTKDKY